MLRTKRNTRQGSGKRNSMFLDSFSLGDYMTNSKSDADIPGTLHDSKNAESDHVSWMRPSRNRNERITISGKKESSKKEKSKLNKSEITISKPTLQRSSVVLDKNMVRDYNLALKHLTAFNEEKEPSTSLKNVVERSGSDSNLSISDSDSSRSSSIFDKTGMSRKEETTNLRSIFFDTDDDDYEYVPSDTIVMSKGKSLIQVYDNKYTRRILSKEIPTRPSNIFESNASPKYERTILEF